MADFYTQEYETLGLWTRLLLHPKEAPPYNLERISKLFEQLGAKLVAGDASIKRSAEDAHKMAPKKLALTQWSIGNEQLLWREDGIFLATTLSEEIATLFHKACDELRDPEETQTFSIVPRPAKIPARKLMAYSVAKIVKPLDRGPFANATYWTTIDHIHDATDTRKRYLKKQGITLEEPPEEGKEASAKA